jgi:hypothetical protein
MRSHRRAALRSLIVALACLALAAPTASARFYPVPPQGPSQPTEAGTFPGLASVAREASAAQGNATEAGTFPGLASAARAASAAQGNPTEAGTFPGLAAAARAASVSPAVAPDAPSVTSNDPGFDWGSAAIGAAAAGGLIALFGLALPALRSRRRVLPSG